MGHMAVVVVVMVYLSWDKYRSGIED
jgi:hypothetical protein